MYKYPCEKCILLGSCSIACNPVRNRMFKENWHTHYRKSIKNQICPRCKEKLIFLKANSLSYSDEYYEVHLKCIYHYEYIIYLVKNDFDKLEKLIK